MNLVVFAQSAPRAALDSLKTPLCHGLGGWPFGVAKATVSGLRCFMPASALCLTALVSIGLFFCYSLIQQESFIALA